VEKEVLRFAIARDEAKSTIRKGFDSSLHDFAVLISIVAFREVRRRFFVA
jgi:hypothetical protein